MAVGVQVATEIDEKTVGGIKLKSQKSERFEAYIGPITVKYTAYIFLYLGYEKP